MLSESELSHGITKLSGSSPFLNVMMAKIYEITEITGAAKMLRVRRRRDNVIRLFNTTGLCVK